MPEEVTNVQYDRIDTWDMVDRAAPRVVGHYLMDRPHDPLFTLARSANPVERRIAITAPLYWARRPAVRYPVEKLAPEIRARY